MLWVHHRQFVTRSQGSAPVDTPSTSSDLMRFIQNLASQTIHLLQKVYQKSKYHRVRQRAQCILLSHQGYTIQELSPIFQVDRITIYNWFDHWESRRFAGLYDRKGRGRPPIFNQDQKEQIKEWIEQYPKNLNKILSLIQQEVNVSASKSTIKRVLKSMNMTWRRIRRKVKDQPDPEVYQQKREALDILVAEDQEGIIDLRYFDESGFCLVPSIPYAWQAAGETISVESGQSKRLNGLGFMNKRNDLEAYTIEGSVDSTVIIHFFNEFCGTIEGPTVVVVDNASIHRSEAFQQELPKWEQEGLLVFYLPEYSPELNRIEILWRFMKYEGIEFGAYASFDCLVQYIEGVIRDFGDKYKINFG